jgi:hypothetical protein
MEDKKCTEVIETLENKIKEIKSKFEPFFKMNEEEINEKLNTEEKAKLHLTYTYAINSLFYSNLLHFITISFFFFFLFLYYFCFFFIYSNHQKFSLVLLKTQGISTSDHPVKKELKRIQEYFQKLKTAANISKSNEKRKRNEEDTKNFLDSLQNNENSNTKESTDSNKNNTSPTKKRKEKKSEKKDKKEKKKKEKKEKKSTDITDKSSSSKKKRKN